MNARKKLLFAGLVIVALLMAALSALWLAPDASAQAPTVIIPGILDNYVIHPGDTISLGYEVAITSPNPDPTTVSVTNTIMRLHIVCLNGSTETLNINVPTQSFQVPANNQNWQPSDSTFEGKTTVPSTFCGGLGGVEDDDTFSTDENETCHSNSAQGCCHSMCFRHHHKHHDSSGDRTPTEFEDGCKPAKQCNSGDKGGCCKQ